jgi:hypothetical protein
MIARRVPAEQIVDQFELVIGLPFSLAADVTGDDGLELTEDENAKLCSVWTPAAIAHAPFLLSKAGVIILPTISTVNVIRYKIMEHMEWRKEQKAKQNEGNNPPLE